MLSFPWRICSCILAGLERSLGDGWKGPCAVRGGDAEHRETPRPVASSVSPSASSEEEEEAAGTAREGWQVNWERTRGKGITKIS